MVYLIIEITIERSIIHIFDNIHLINDFFVIIAMYNIKNLVKDLSLFIYLIIARFPLL